MSLAPQSFDAVRVLRQTAETHFELVIRPRTERLASLALPNRLLSHFLDHFCKASGITVETVQTDWPGSWCLDHVLCEDLGQLVGRGIAAIHDQRAKRQGVPGRGAATGCMDDAVVALEMSMEGRPIVRWVVPDGLEIDGFVDTWYDADGRVEGWGRGTNLRQFIDGLAYGSRATLTVTVRQGGNLHHLYEALFRALGDAVGKALGTGDAGRVPGDSSGLAGTPEYSVEVIDAAR